MAGWTTAATWAIISRRQCWSVVCFSGNNSSTKILYFLWNRLQFPKFHMIKFQGFPKTLAVIRWIWVQFDLCAQKYYYKWLNDMWNCMVCTTCTGHCMLDIIFAYLCTFVINCHIISRTTNKRTQNCRDLRQGTNISVLIRYFFYIPVTDFTSKCQHPSSTPPPYRNEGQSQIHQNEETVHKVNDREGGKDCKSICFHS